MFLARGADFASTLSLPVHYSKKTFLAASNLAFSGADAKPASSCRF
jgi:hypothetical protein